MRNGRQSGSTLIVTLVMLVMLTLIAVSAINTTSGMIQIVGNAQFRQEAAAAGQQAIETLISAITATSDPASTATTMGTVNIDINRDTQGDYAVAFTPAPACISRITVPTAGTEFNGLLSHYKTIAEDEDNDEPTRTAASLKYQQLYQCVGTVACFWTVWQVSAAVSDTFTGASTVVNQGIKVFASTKTVSNKCTT